MPKVVAIGIQDFEKIRKGGYFYVDKTSFIKEWWENGDDVTLITRPRRFGKTLTIDMLHCFFSTEYTGGGDLFEGLAVSSDNELMRLQGTIPTIKISFAGLKGETFRSLLRRIAGRISTLLSRYRYLMDADCLDDGEKELLSEMIRLVPRIPDPEKDEDGYEEFLYKLTHILHILSGWLQRVHGKKVLILMDEYDTPVQAAYTNGYYDEAVTVLREMFAETFKENECLGRAVITGITRIAKESLFSDMNNIAVCSVISGGYNTSFGFTQHEMDEILKEYELSDKKDLVRFWYDGFTVGTETGIYNPWSIVNYLAGRPNPPEDYWAKSGGVGLIDRLVRRGSISLKEGFETLLGGGVIRRRIRDDLIFPWLEGDENSVWSLLIAAGYVKILPETRTESGELAKGNEPDIILSAESRLKRPITLTNHESWLSLTEMVNMWFATRSGNYMEQFADALLADDLQYMNETMRQVLLTSASSFDSAIRPSSGNIQPENFFHALTLGMLTCLSDDYRVTSNRESGFGRYDVCVKPIDGDAGKKHFAAVMKFKVFDKKKGDKVLADTARRARRQIDDMKYDAELLEKGIPAGEIRKYGFGFCGKNVVIV